MSIRLTHYTGVASAMIIRAKRGEAAAMRWALTQALRSEQRNEKQAVQIRLHQFACGVGGS